MKLFKKLLAKKPQRPAGYEGFWHWFAEKEANLYAAIEDGEDIPNKVLYPIANELRKLREGYLPLVGMPVDGVAELVFTASGLVKNFVFMDDLVARAPELENWKFTALKPAMDPAQFGINMHELNFSQEKMKFFAVQHEKYPDLIHLKFTHEDATEDNLQQVQEGVLVYLQHILGEENYLSIIDQADVILEDEVSDDLISIEKLDEYLLWRQKEFIEKYEGFRHHTDQDNYGVYEALMESGNRQLATLNSDLLQWDKKASHPWMLIIAIQYETTRDDRLPDEATGELLNTFEDRLLAELKDSDGYLNIGRESCNGIREIYFACQEVRDCSRTVDRMLRLYRNHFKGDYAIYKDKYWRTFDSYDAGATTASDEQE